MKIRWTNVIIFLLSIAAALLLWHHWHSIGVALDSIKNIGPGNSTTDKTTGLLVLGLIGVCIVAIVKILTNQKIR